jgi:hypothetical protein
MKPIRTNKPNFFADDGRVLQNGFVFIGLPNQDPRNFPKTVTFQDSAGGRFTAAQPLRTNAQGQIAYNGKAIVALVDGNYSMLVLDSNQVQIRDGWTPLVEDVGQPDPNDAIPSYPTLAAIKALSPNPGDYLRSIGNITEDDRNGADWLVTSNTGTPGNDTTLIDFPNGTQGRIVFRYRKSDAIDEDDSEQLATSAAANAVRLTAFPKTIGAASENEADPDGHTHEIGASAIETSMLVSSERMTTANVLSQTAGAAAGAVGTYVFAHDTGSSKDFGDTQAGSSLRPVSANGNPAGQPALTGTWRLMGNMATGTDQTRSSVWLRIS